MKLDFFVHGKKPVYTVDTRRIDYGEERLIATRFLYKIKLHVIMFYMAGTMDIARIISLRKANNCGKLKVYEQETRESAIE